MVLSPLAFYISGDSSSKALFRGSGKMATNMHKNRAFYAFFFYFYT